MNTQISVLGNTYQFKEQFDVNLTLDYENDTWGEWHIVREFVSNALDSVKNDISKIDINIESEYLFIRDFGDGYPLVFAKRIGASIKRNDTDSIGQFGEGVKLAILTCIRNNIQVMLASQNWLIQPKTVDIEDQQVLMYDVFETEASIDGTFVLVEANDKIREITRDIDQYFLYFSKDNCLFGNLSSGIFPPKNGISKLYNKGVFVKDITAEYSYAISIEKLNRDRDFISYSDTAHMIKELWEKVDDVKLLRTLLEISALPYEQRNKHIEFYLSMYPKHPEAWAKAFYEQHGKNAVLFTNDIACREAEILGFKVIKAEYNISNILDNGGIKKDTNCLSADYEFTFANELDNKETQVIQKLFSYAKLLQIEVPEHLKIFESYENDNEISGLYNPENKQIYLRRNLLNSDFSKALSVFLHEANHHISKSDDISREFSESLCSLLTRLLIMYENEVGIDSELLVTSKGLILPSSFRLTADSLYATLILIGNELLLIVGQNTIKTTLPITHTQSITVKRKIIIRNGCFIVSLPETILDALQGCQKIKCRNTEQSQ